MKNKHYLLYARCECGKELKIESDWSLHTNSANIILTCPCGKHVPFKRKESMPYVIMLKKH